MFCPSCGVQLPDGTLYCQQCGWQEMRPVVGADNDPAMRMLIPIGRSPLAVIAGYAGLFAIIPIFAPFALLLGWLALRDLKKHPENGGKGRAIFAIVMGGLFSALLMLAVASIAISVANDG
ncbi:MAG: DUF4190 domain-containing protein [Planctomycetota bacterium]